MEKEIIEREKYKLRSEEKEIIEREKYKLRSEEKERIKKARYNTRYKEIKVLKECPRYLKEENLKEIDKGEEVKASKAEMR